jgi:predicted MFS family arabinose efflux permease
MGVAFAYTVMWQFYPTWFPTYLVEKRRFTLVESSWYAGLPFLFGLAATWAGGVLTDFTAERLGVRRGRLLVGAASLLFSASLVAAGMLWPGREVAAILIALAAGAGDILLGVSWATAVEIGGGAAGAASGMMNTASNAGAFLSPVVMGWAVTASGEWDSVLALGAMANLAAAVLWLNLHRRADADPFSA